MDAMLERRGRIGRAVAADQAPDRNADNPRRKARKILVISSTSYAAFRLYNLC